ncbi:RsmD family RNA methyltransferase [Psychrobacter sp. TAE2020]|uniref:RsmD family RNA methyltransferase n=1 Tax=Psychrobacter sp. TAE2020 TaxID=2846762 RepID=UPI003A7F136C
MKKPVSSRKVIAKPAPRGNTKMASKAKSATAGEVRIIGGQFKRRSISFIEAQGLRPTPDRLRETLFNWLIADIHGARVLDSCAGSGVLGFEALSRGAAHCTFIEMNAVQSQRLQYSAEQLRLDASQYQVIQGQAEQVLEKPAEFLLSLPPCLSAQSTSASASAPIGAHDSKQNSEHHIGPFNLVFIDPPYADDLWQPILTALIEYQWIDASSVIYLEADKDLTEQLAVLAATLRQNAATANFQGFDCLKQTKVGQVVAGLYTLASS